MALAGLTLVTSIVVLVTSGAEASDGGPSTVVSWMQLAFGLLFLLLAVRQWRSRPAAGQVPEPPRWMATLDRLGMGRAAVLGAALSGANPKNLALTVAAAATIGQGALDTGGNVVAIVVFVVIGSLTVAGPTLWYLVAPGRPLARSTR